jgi:hypothetical protein
MNKQQRSKYGRRARAVGAVLVGVAAAPSILAGDLVGVGVTLVAGFAVFYAGAYSGWVSQVPTE